MSNAATKPDFPAVRWSGSYSRVSRQLHETIRLLVELDNVAADLACGDSVMHTPESIHRFQSLIDHASHKWCTEVLGGSDAFYIDDGIQCLKALLERNIEADRPPTDEEAREIYHEDKMDHLRAMGG